MNRCPYCGKNMASEYSPQVFVAGWGGGWGHHGWGWGHHGWGGWGYPGWGWGHHHYWRDEE